MISAAWRRAPCTNTPASVSGGLPTATLAISVAVSMASQRPPFIPAPPIPPSGIPSSYPLENTDVGLVTVAQVEVSIERRRPWARPPRPFDGHGGACAAAVPAPYL